VYRKEFEEGRRMTTLEPEFIHRFVPRINSAEERTLLLLHGTGGNEDDLIPLGQELLPGAAILSPRGKTLEQGMPRFFRRLAEGVFDIEDLQIRTAELAAFVLNSAKTYNFDADKVVAVGYSNGANIAASLLFTEPKVLNAAVLFHAMLPFLPDPLPNLLGKPIFLTAGQSDPIVAPENVEALASLLTDSGADVTFYQTDGGHELSGEEFVAARQWAATEL
jgi:predicted esterase